MAHVFFPIVSLLQVMLPRRTLKPKARVSVKRFSGPPCVLHPFSSLPISPPTETRTCMHACAGQVPSFTMSPSWRTPSRIIIIAPSADAAEANKRRGHFHTAAVAYYTYMHILYNRQTDMSKSKWPGSIVLAAGQSRAGAPTRALRRRGSRS